MRMESPVTQSWRRIKVFYRLLEDMNHFGFSIEAVGCLPENPSLWLEESSVVIHHSGQLFIELANMPERLLEEIKSRDEVMLSETYRRHYSDGLVPWGLDRVGGAGPIYAVPIIHTEKIGDIRRIFNSLPETSHETSTSPIAE